MSKKIDLANLTQEGLDLLASHQKDELAAIETYRLCHENSWLSALRRLKSSYSDEELKAFGKNESKIHPNYSRCLTEPLLAILSNVTPAGDKDWEIVNTPIPTIREETRKQIEVSLIQQDPQTGQMIFPTQKQIDDAVLKFAMDRCANMSRLIDDQMVDDNIVSKDRLVDQSAVYYGTGIMKGPLGERITTPEYGINESGAWEMRDSKNTRPSGEFIPIWRWYPDISATTIDKCNFVWELHCMTRHELRALAKRDDFLGDVILKILSEKPEGDYKLRPWETNLQAEGKDPQTARTTQNYEVRERNGFVDGKDLVAMGLIEEDDAKLEFFCSIWYLADKVISVQVYPPYMRNLGDLYHIFYYSKDETSIYGTGLLEIIKHKHQGIASCERRMMDNAAWTAGPLIEIRALQLDKAQADNIANIIHPGGIILNIGTGSMANIDAIKVHEIESRLEELQSLRTMFEEAGYREACLPAALFGQPGMGGNTKEGAAKLSTSIDFIKSLIRRKGEAKTSFIRSVYNFNMHHSKDESVKGDMHIGIVDVSNIIIKEEILAKIAFFLQSAPENFIRRIKEGEYLEQVFKGALPGASKFIKTDEEIAAENAAMAAQRKEVEDLQKQNMSLNNMLTAEKARHQAAMTALKESKSHTEPLKIHADLQSQALQQTKDGIEIAKTIDAHPHEIDAMAIENNRGMIDNARAIQGGTGDEQGG